jgi:hypothetical protein
MSSRPYSTRFSDTADLEASLWGASGIFHVVVNAVSLIEDGEFTGRISG